MGRPKEPHEVIIETVMSESDHLYLNELLWTKAKASRGPNKKRLLRIIAALIDKPVSDLEHYLSA